MLENILCAIVSVRDNWSSAVDTVNVVSAGSLYLNCIHTGGNGSGAPYTLPQTQWPHDIPIHRVYRFMEEPNR
jgi:hypothetical protein